MLGLGSVTMDLNPISLTSDRQTCEGIGLENAIAPCLLFGEFFHGFHIFYQAKTLECLFENWG